MHNAPFSAVRKFRWLALPHLRNLATQRAYWIARTFFQSKSRDRLLPGHLFREKIPRGFQHGYRKGDSIVGPQRMTGQEESSTRVMQMRRAQDGPMRGSVWSAMPPFLSAPRRIPDESRKNDRRPILP